MGLLTGLAFLSAYYLSGWVGLLTGLAFLSAHLSGWVGLLLCFELYGVYSNRGYDLGQDFRAWFAVVHAGQGGRVVVVLSLVRGGSLAPRAAAR